MEASLFNLTSLAVKPFLVSLLQQGLQASVMAPSFLGFNAVQQAWQVPAPASTKARLRPQLGGALWHLVVLLLQPHQRTRSS